MGIFYGYGLSNTISNTSNYKFALIVSGLYLIIAFVLFLVGLLSGNVLNVYGVLYPICFLSSIASLVYVIITHKKRKLVDFIICGVIFLSFAIIEIEALSFFYRARTGDIFYTLYYKIPGILNFNTHALITKDPICFDIMKTDSLFDPTLIITFICFIVSSVLFIIDKRKTKKL